MPSIEIQGRHLHYRDEGAGEPVILVHSSGCSSSQWRSLSEHLGPGYRILAPDLYGYGQSDGWSGERPIRLADEAEVVEALMALTEQPVHLVGHSYGGAVALRAAINRPFQVKSLTLIEPVAIQLLRKSDNRGALSFTEIRGVADRVAGAIAIGDNRSAMAHFVDYWNGPGNWFELSDQQQQALIKVAPKIALDFWAITSDPAELDDYRCLDLPTLLICGDQSPMPTRRITAMLGGTLPGALVRVVGGAGHMLPLTHGEQVNPLIAGHLSGVAEIERAAA